MKKFVVIFAFMLLFCASSNSMEVKNDRGYISVNIEATKDLSPTSARISFVVENSDKDPQVAGENNKQSSIKTINAIKSLIDEANGESIKTSSYCINPEYSYKDGQKKMVGYLASNTLQVTIKDTEKVGKLISAALSNGATSVHNLQFLLEGQDENCNLLIQEASKNAKIRADKIAESMGTKVEGIKSINAGCYVNQSFQTNYRYSNVVMSSKADSLGEAMPVESGKNQIRANVSADFYVK